MLDSITLKFTDSPSLSLPMQGITVFVGPNNSGKSLVLKEVEQALSVHPFPQNLLILDDYEVQWQSISAVDAFIEGAKGEPNPNLAEGNVPIARVNPNDGMDASNINLDMLHQIVTQRQDKRWYATQYLRYGLIRLDGRSRFNLTNDQSAGDLLKPAQNILGRLFKDDTSRLKARGFVQEAFGLNLIIDPTKLGSLRIGLSQDEALTDEQSLNEAARSFHARSTYIKDASDGVQAYVGIISGVVSGEYHTVLIDEPEAFLHPPLARKLGRQLSKLATSRNGSLLASTHSADFLTGCIQGSAEVRVIRLEYQNGKSKGRLVDAIQLKKLFQNPLMRSTNATSALFYDGVIVTESDNDRAFYAEVYYRLVEVNPGLPSVLFVNAQNKQTIKDIMGPLRQFGVPAAAITDIDVVKEGGVNWTNWLEAAKIPEPLRVGNHNQRSAIYAEFEKVHGTGKDMKRDGGVGILDPSQAIAANHFFDELNAYGIFPVRSRELESWLKALGVKGQKTKWAIAMLQTLGSDPSDAAYIRPGVDDVWKFLTDVLDWISNPARKGTP